MAESPRIAELQQKFEDNPRRYFASLANEYRKAGDLQRAVSVCRIYLDRQPDHTAGHVVLGQALYEIGKAEEAAEAFQTVVELDPENLIALRYLGDFAREKGNLTLAQDYFRKVLTADPRDHETSGRLKDVTQALKRTVAGTEEDWIPPRTEEYAIPVSDPVSDPVPTAVPEDVAVDDFVEPVVLEEAESSAESLADVDPEVTSWEALAAPFVPLHPMRTGEYSLSRDTVELNIEPEKIEPEEIEPEEIEPEEIEPEEIEPEEIEPEEYAPVEPAGPFITETVAELYLQQGFTGEALVVYRQLARLKPDDQRISGRIEALEQRLSAEHTVRQAALEAESAPIEELPPSIDFESVESDDWFAGSSVQSARSRQTVREFFAVLASARPDQPRVPQMNRVTAEDIGAAAEIAAAFGAYGSTPTIASPKPIASQAHGASDEQDDVHRFRAWLDGLSDS